MKYKIGDLVKCGNFLGIIKDVLTFTEPNEEKVVIYWYNWDCLGNAETLESKTNMREVQVICSPN